jgi:uncharacterized protein (DUF2344 family)
LLINIIKAIYIILAMYENKTRNNKKTIKKLFKLLGQKKIYVCLLSHGQKNCIIRHFTRNFEKEIPESDSGTGNDYFWVCR